MAKRKKKTADQDGKSAGAGPDTEPLDGIDALHDQATRHDDGDSGVFDGPLDPEKALEELIALNHERTECTRRWEDAKAEASEAKKELDNASNAISLLIDRIDRQMNGTGAQPVLATLGGNAEATV